MVLEEDDNLDLSKYSKKLFSQGEYDMFPLENTDPDDSYKVDGYGVFKERDSESAVDMLNNIIYHLGAGYDPGALEDKDMGFGATTLNNSVSYADIKEHFDSYKYLYHPSEEHVSINCQTAYIPFEGRIDKKSFQIILSETRPKNLIVVNASQLKVERIRKYVNRNKLNINVEYVMNQDRLDLGENSGIHTFKLSTIPKESVPVDLHPKLLMSTTSRHTHPLDAPYNVSRIYGKFQLNSNTSPKNPGPQISNSSLTPLTQTHQIQLKDIENDQTALSKKEKYLFESSTLFFTDISHRLSDLQKFLSDKGFVLEMINKKLDFEGKVEIWQDPQGDFKINGILCEEYVKIRKLIYEHYSAV